MEGYFNSLVWLLVFGVVQVLSSPLPPHRRIGLKNEEPSDPAELNPCTLKGFISHFIQSGYELPAIDYHSPMPYNSDDNPAYENEFEELKELVLHFLYNVRYYEYTKKLDFGTAYNIAVENYSALAERLEVLFEKIYG